MIELVAHTKNKFISDLESLINTARSRESFKPVRVTVKNYKRSKTPPQHRAYWVAVSQLKKAFIEAGYDTNEKEVHEFVKKKCGYTKIMHGEMIAKSIADTSKDATREELKRLIDFILRFSAEELGHVISLNSDEFN